MHRVLVVDTPRGAKVDELDDVLSDCAEMQVMGLDVSMHDLLGMQVRNCREKLANDFGCFHLRERLLLGNSLVKRASKAHLVDKVHLFRVLVHLYDPSDVGVVQCQEELNLVEQLPAFTEFEVLLPDHLDGSCDFRELVDTSSDATQSALSDHFMQLVVVFDVVLVLEVKLFWVQLDAVSLRGVEGTPDFEQIFEVLPRECDELLRLCSYYLLDEVL